MFICRSNLEITKLGQHHLCRKATYIFCVSMILQTSHGQLRNGIEKEGRHG